MKIDHIFICVKSPNKFVKILTDFGITEGEPNTHTGQGTSNHRFFFNNIYLQLLHVTDEDLLQSPRSKPSGLFERFARTDNSISPFGICLYPGEGRLEIVDYLTKEYQPKFIHPPLKMHIFICVETPQLVAQILKNFGLSEGEPNTHRGQGTANKRFFFQDFFLELIFVDNEDDLKSATTAPTKLHERFFDKTKTASPFGIIFRPSDNGFDPNNFQTQAYNPKYLPSPLTMTIIDGPVTDPLYFYFDFLTDSSRANYTKTQHKNGISKMTSMSIAQPNIGSPIQQEFEKHQIISFKENDTHLLKISFDDERRGKSHDFRPALPLIFKW